MKKLINGTVIEIEDIELFEKAFEGIAMGRLVASSVQDTLSHESSFINDCLVRYEAFYKAMPFPLYAIENNVKYAAIGTFIRDSLSDEVLEMHVANALYIYLSESKALKLVSKTWAIVNIQKRSEDNANIEYFTHEDGYRHFHWILSNLMDNVSCDTYYSRFFNPILKACNNEPIILKWELTHMLEFAPVPEMKTLLHSQIINLDTGSEYVLDIFSVGKKRNNNICLNVTINKSGIKIKDDVGYSKRYDFDVHEKKKTETGDFEDKSVGKMEKANLDGVAALFQTLLSSGYNKTSNDRDDVTPFYCGVVSGDKLIYMVNERLFITSVDKYEKPREIARGVLFYGCMNGNVYFSKRTSTGTEVKKEKIYCLETVSENVRLCKTQFI